VTIPGSSLRNGAMAITLSAKYAPITGFWTEEHETDTMAKTTNI